MKIGVDLGGSHIAVGLIDDSGNIVKKEDIEILEEDKANIKDIIENYIITEVNKMKEFHKVESIGMAIPGTVDEEKIIKSVNLGLENYEIVKELNKQINLPIMIKNDAKCAAMAENAYGCIKQYNNAIFLTLGTGIGGAVIYDGNLLSPKNLPGFEFGHMIIVKNGKQCKCGKRGCFEQYGSMHAFKMRVIDELHLDERIAGEDLLAVVKKEQNNPIIENIIDEYTDYLSIGISNLINIFEPEAIGIGGSFVYFEDLLLPILNEKILNSNLLFNHHDSLAIVPATLGNSAGIIGTTLIKKS
jgi:glucokinase